MNGIGHNSATFGEGLQEFSPVLPDDHKKLFHYVQWHLSDYITGTQGMTPEQEGIYMRFLVRLYDRGQAFRDDEKILALAMGLDVRRWRRIRAELIGFGKIVIKHGFLTNSRFEREKLKRAEDLRKQADSTRKYWEKRRAESGAAEEVRDEVGEKSGRSPRDVRAKSDEKANEINEDVKHPTSQTRDQRLEKKEEEGCPNGHLPSDEPKAGDGKKLKAAEAARMAFNLYNAMAERLGLPIAHVLTETRKGKIITRIREAGGMSAFERVLGNIEKSAFLQGRNDSGFRADFDFICQAKSFSRLMDGGYGNGAHAVASTKNDRFFDGAL